MKLKTGLILLLFTGYCSCETGIGVDLFPLPSDYSIKKSSSSIHSEVVSGFANYTALKTGYTYEKIYNLEIKGYGRTEILIICLTAKKSNNEIDNLIKSRDSGKRLKEIVESNKVDYKDVYVEAKTLKHEIDAAILTEKADSKTLKSE